MFGAKWRLCGVKRAVVDTSVLISAVLFPASIPGQLVHLAEVGRFTLQLSPIIFGEFCVALARDRLRRSHGYSDSDIARWCVELTEIGAMLAEPLPEIEAVCRDPDDDHVIAAAVASEAGWIVTGDKDLLSLAEHGTIRIVTPRDFIGLI